MTIPTESMHSGMHSAQFMGLINAVRTGDPTLDMIAAFLLPLLVQQLITHIPAKLRRLWHYLFSKKVAPIRKFKRNIVYRTRQQNGCKMSDDEDSFNMYLLRAIQLYVHHHCNIKALDDAHFDLTLLDTSRCQQNTRNGRMTLTNTNGATSNNSTVNMLQTCTLVEKPLENTWLDVGEHGGGKVEIMVCDTTSGGGNNKNNGEGEGGNGDGAPGGGNEKQSTRSLEVKLQSETSVECLHVFVKTVFDWYVNEVRKLENNDRFMLDVQPMMAMRSNSTPNYVAYKLGDEKTFDTLFNRKCHDLLGWVDHFENKTGKYAIKGYPHKLGLLLTGVPGTGKTSLIKALAHRTGRHIVNINLAHIGTNGDLRRIFFNKFYQISGGGINQQLRLDFNQVIFVLEDVDASAKEIVMDRDMLAEIEEERAAALKKSKEEEEKEKEKPGAATRPRIGSTHSPGIDKLNLSGLLNVLDGVVETPGRMVIMTTNHPEILDPALIRPGRIDKILELGHMEDPEDVAKMLEHYYDERSLTSQERTNITKYVASDDIKITPAQVEQLAMEQDTLTGFLECLATFGKDKKPNKRNRVPKDMVIDTSPTNSTLNSAAMDALENFSPDEIEDYLADGGDLMDLLYDECYGDY